MKICRLAAVAVAALTLLRPCMAQAQTAPISLQGRLTGVADGEHDFTLTIWDVATGGTPVHEVTGTATVSGGLFTVSADLPATAFNGAARWWSVAVDGGPPTDRLPLTDVPQALVARGLVDPRFGSSLRFTDNALELRSTPGGPSFDFFVPQADVRAKQFVLASPSGASTLAMRWSDAFAPGPGFYIGPGDLLNPVFIGRADGLGLTWILNQLSVGQPGRQVPVAIYGTTEMHNDLIVNDDVQCKTLRITGGSDLAEPFPAAPASIEPRPGMVLSIDPATPGALRVCDEAYDTKVAGVYSGGNGLNTGMLMGQDGDAHASHGEDTLPLAMTGRVWVYADDSNGPIVPGERLTTSGANAGYAARVADPSRADGAVIGKAMTGIDADTGMVLVLVNLQ